MTILIGRATPVHVTKYDGSYHRRFPARFVVQKGPLYLLTITQGDAISATPDPADDPSPFHVRWGGELYLYEDRWFNIARALRDGRRWFYVNIATPAEFDGQQFSCIDLDLDIAWYTDEAPRVLDEDEFLDHSRSMRYPAAIIESARAAVDEVFEMIQARAFPFDRA